MIEKFVIPLGSGSAAGLPTHASIRALDRAVRAGMQVPSGHVVLPALADLAVLHGALSIEGGRIEVLDPPVMRLWLDGASRGEGCWIRSLTVIDSTAPAKTPKRIASDSVLQAIVSHWHDHLREHADATIQPVLIQQAPIVEHVGRAWTSNGIGRDVVSIGGGTPHEIALERFFGWERAPNPPDLVPVHARLQSLLRDVRRWLGGEHWMIDWADDGARCWLLSASPCESAHARHAALAIVPVAGSGGGPFTPLVADIWCAAIEQVWARAISIDRGLSEVAPPACVANGRLYVDPADVATVLQTWGLGHRVLLPFVPDPFGSVLKMRMARVVHAVVRGTGFRHLVAHAQATLTPPRSAHAFRQDAGPPTPLELFDRTVDLYGSIMWRSVHLWLAATFSAGETGQKAVLDAFAGRMDKHRLAADATMRHLAGEYLSVRRALERGELPDNAEFQAVWTRAVQRWGARAGVELELAYARDRESGADILRGLLLHGETVPSRPTGLAGMLLRPLLIRAARLGEAFARDLDAARAAWLDISRQLNEEGILETRDDVWILTRDDFARLAAGWRPGGDFWTVRRSAWEELCARSPEETIDRIFCNDQAKSLDTPRA